MGRRNETMPKKTDELVRKRRSFPCTECSSDCRDGSIYCSSCRRWTHVACVGNLTDELLLRLRSKYVQFLCPTCANVSGVFDFGNSLHRLRVATDADKQFRLSRIVAVTEKCLLDVYTTTWVPPASVVTVNDIEEDSISSAILNMSHPSVLDNFVPACVHGDGNCLFRAVSLSLFGTQENHVYLRLITALEIIMNRPFYDRRSYQCLNPFSTQVEVPHYSNIVRQAVTDGSSCGMMHLFAVSAAIRRPLLSYCPIGATYCSALVPHPYTMRVTGRDVPDDASCETFPTVMWTATQIPASVRDLVPNHFVSLIPRNGAPTAAMREGECSNDTKNGVDRFKNNTIVIDLISDDDDANSDPSDLSCSPVGDREMPCDVSPSTRRSQQSRSRLNHSPSTSPADDQRPHDVIADAGDDSDNVSAPEPNMSRSGKSRHVLTSSPSNGQSHTPSPHDRFVDGSDDDDSDSRAQSDHSSPLSNEDGDVLQCGELRDHDDSEDACGDRSDSVKENVGGCDCDSSTDESVTKSPAASAGSDAAFSVGNRHADDGTCDDVGMGDLSDSPSDDIPSGCRRLPSGGLSTAELLAILQRQPQQGLRRIPSGTKNDVFCVIDNTCNAERQKRGLTNRYDDDCGVWMSSAGHATQHPYVKTADGRYRRIFYIAKYGKYCQELKINGKRQYAVLEEQPDSGDVITVCRNYSTLQANPNYRRRVSVTRSSQGNFSQLAVVEYIGRHRVGRPHGNKKVQAGSNAYVRTPAETMDAVNKMNHRLPVKAVYNRLIADLDVDRAPRNKEVVRNQKKSDKRKRLASEGRQSCSTVADEWLAVYNLMQSVEVIRFVGAAPNRVPTVIVYNDKQIRDIKAFCFHGRNGSVLSFDKTYNLGSIYVTVSVYKNAALIKRNTGQQPLFIGPLFLHGHSDFETYATFFSHLAVKLIDCDHSQLTLGSDEELAIRKCMSTFFPRASIVVCSRHVKQNTVRKLDSLLGKKSHERKELFDAIYGSAGLMSCSDISSFDATVQQLVQGIMVRSPPQFTAYFEGHVVPLLRANAAAGRNTWTNNNCEAVNHVLKQYTQWRPQQLPDLVIQLRDLINGQHLEADRALIGLGDFDLQRTHMKHRVTVDAWRAMSETQRLHLSNACFKWPTVPSSTSADGTFTVPLTPGAGKKRQQRKRRRTEKTVNRPRCRRPKRPIASHDEDDDNSSSSSNSSVEP